MPEDPALRLTERRNPRTQRLDQATPLELVAMIAAEDAMVPAAVAAAAEEVAGALALVERAFRNGGRLFYVGAGTSGRLGVLDAAECPPTFGSLPEQVQGIIAGGPDALVRAVEGAEDSPIAGATEIDVRSVTAHDVVIGIAASGVTPFVRGALQRAREIGAGTVLLTCADPPNEVAAHADIAIILRTGPEVVTGSTRMKAGTATKLVLNTITTGAMVRLGKTYGNLMVDLQATNAKLIDRGQRIVMEVAGVDRSRAVAALEAANGSVRTAIVIARTGASRPEAEQMLADNDHRLRAIIGDPPPVPDYA